MTINFYIKEIGIKSEKEIDGYLQECYCKRGECNYSFEQIGVTKR